MPARNNKACTMRSFASSRVSSMRVRTSAAVNTQPARLPGTLSLSVGIADRGITHGVALMTSNITPCCSTRCSTLYTQRIVRGAVVPPLREGRARSHDKNSTTCRGRTSTTGIDAMAACAMWRSINRASSAADGCCCAIAHCRASCSTVALLTLGAVHPCPLPCAVAALGFAPLRGSQRPASCSVCIALAYASALACVSAASPARTGIAHS